MVALEALAVTFLVLGVVELWEEGEAAVAAAVVGVEVRVWRDLYCSKSASPPAVLNNS
jgi:hypothetical protein